MADRRVEINPGEWFMLADNTILAAEYESVIGDVFKIGSPEHRMEYLLTFRGKVNNRDEQGSFTVAMSPQSALLDGAWLPGPLRAGAHPRPRRELPAMEQIGDPE